MTLAENEHDQMNAAVKPAIVGVQAPTEIDESKAAQIEADLSVPYKLSSSSIDKFARDGYIKLKNNADHVQRSDNRVQHVKFLNPSISLTSRMGLTSKLS